MTRQPQAPTAPRPAYGHNKDGQRDLKQVLLSLGVSGDGGLPLRMGLCDGNTSDSVDVRHAIEESLALGLDGVKGIVADSKAYSQRTLGLCLEQQVGLVTLVPRTCAIRQEVEAWGQQQRSLPLWLEKPGRTPSRPASAVVWAQCHTRGGGGICGRSGRPSTRALCGGVLESVGPATRPGLSARPKPQEAEEASPSISPRWRPDALPVRPMPKRRSPSMKAHGRGGVGGARAAGATTRCSIRCRRQWQRKKRTRRGRPPKDEPVEEELVYRLQSQAQALAPPVATFGWLVLATTLSEHTCGDAEMVRAYRDQTTTVEPGFRWIKNPAAISPVWLEKPKRIAALAMLTVVGLLVYALIQRQVRQYLQLHQQCIARQ